MSRQFRCHVGALQPETQETRSDEEANCHSNDAVGFRSEIRSSMHSILRPLAGRAGWDPGTWSVEISFYLDRCSFITTPSYRRCWVIFQVLIGWPPLNPALILTRIPRCACIRVSHPRFFVPAGYSCSELLIDEAEQTGSIQNCTQHCVSVYSVVYVCSKQQFLTGLIWRRCIF